VPVAWCADRQRAVVGRSRESRWTSGDQTPSFFASICPGRTATPPLKEQGFSVGYTPANRHFIEAIVRWVRQAAAFDTTFGMYRVGSVSLRSPHKNLTVPSNLPAMAGVAGLDESAALVQIHTHHPRQIRRQPS
jgi:hypothetical protein